MQPRFWRNFAKLYPVSRNFKQTVSLSMIKILSLFVVILLSCNGNAQNENFAITSTAKTLKYKSDEINELTLNLQDSTYTYKEIYNPKAGEDLGYENDSRGKFSIKNDTITFVSQIPSEIDVTKNWNISTEFLELFPTKEQNDKNFVKIYFDNIAEPQLYKAFEYKDGHFESLKIKEYKTLENIERIAAKNDSIPLIHYLLIEKPSNNKLLLLNGENDGRSYYFDLDRIPFRSFHFYTRAYWGYYDFTGLKFVKNGAKLQLIEDNRLNRFRYSILEKTFIQQ